MYWLDIIPDLQCVFGFFSPPTSRPTVCVIAVSTIQTCNWGSDALVQFERSGNTLWPFITAQRGVQVWQVNKQIPQDESSGNVPKSKLRDEDTDFLVCVVGKSWISTSVTKQIHIKKKRHWKSSRARTQCSYHSVVTCKKNKTKKSTLVGLKKIYISYMPWNTLSCSNVSPKELYSYTPWVFESFHSTIYRDRLRT